MVENYRLDTGSPVFQSCPCKMGSLDSMAGRITTGDVPTNQLLVTYFVFLLFLWLWRLGNCCRRRASNGYFSGPESQVNKGCIDFEVTILNDKF